MPSRSPPAVSPSARLLRVQGVITLMSIHADCFVYRFPQTIDTTDRAMLGQRMPWVERHVVAEQILLAAIEILGWELDGCDGFERRDRLTPFYAGVFDRHVVVRVLALHLQGETRRNPVQGKLLIERAAQEVGEVPVGLR